MAIIIAAASDAHMYTIVYWNMAEVTKFFFVVCRDPAIEINRLTDLKFIDGSEFHRSDTATGKELMKGC